MHLHADAETPDSTSQPTLHCTTAAGTDADIVTHCAQELFSLFILAIVAEVSSVGGTTSSLPQTGTQRLWNNTLLTSLAEQAVQAKLATNLDEALALVVPAFAHYNLLPTPHPDEQRAHDTAPCIDTGVGGVDGAEGIRGEEGNVGGDDQDGEERS